MKRTNLISAALAALLLLAGCQTQTDAPASGQSEGTTAAAVTVTTTEAAATETTAALTETNDGEAASASGTTEATEIASTASTEASEASTEAAETKPTSSKTSKPTEPKETTPKATEPKPTQPKPTEPKPTQPKPTEPKPTQPKCSKWEDHKWSNWIQVKAPTSCKEEGAGEEQIVCTKCGYVVQTSYPTLPHHWSNWKQTKAPTCSAKGAETRTCGNCGRTENRELEKLKHSYTTQTVAPTCTEGGYTVKTCSLCGAKETVDQTAALGHDWVHHSEDGWWQSVITCYCGEKFYSIRGVEGSAYSAWDAHSDSFYDTENEDDHAGYEIHEVWVIDTPAYDVCSRCGATK